MLPVLAPAAPTADSSPRKKLVRGGELRTARGEEAPGELATSARNVAMGEAVCRGDSSGETPGDTKILGDEPVLGEPTCLGEARGE
mmetsp:Transcript_45462/g.120592  ORF Transcript_45462/g.120592 Transcript_45462/m.120592 type:complete len:86 (-) Transcript_45462:165-422(-)